MRSRPGAHASTTRATRPPLGQGSPVQALMALISYLIDPVVMAPAGKDGRSVMVYASCNDPDKAVHPRRTAASGIPGTTSSREHPEASPQGVCERSRQTWIRTRRSPALPRPIAPATSLDEGNHPIDDRGPDPTPPGDALLPRLWLHRRTLSTSTLLTQMLEANIAVTRCLTRSRWTCRWNPSRRTRWKGQVWATNSGISSRASGK